MAKMSKSMSVASRLAAATALTGTLAACDGRIGRASDALFAPISADVPAQAVASQPPAAPGNPVYVGGTKAANDALYQQAYGAPLQGSGQAVKAPVVSAPGPSVYQDNAISQTAIGSVAASPAYESGAITPNGIGTAGRYSIDAAPLPVQPVAVQPGGYSAPITADVYSAPVQTYSAPVQSTFPAIGTDPTYLPQSALQQPELYTDASAGSAVRDIEPMLGSADAQPYGSSASHRYSVASTPAPMVDMTTVAAPISVGEAGQMSYPGQILDESLGGTYASVDPIASIETVEVASLSGGGFMPMPRSRPARTDPVMETASLAVPVPISRPKMLRTPLPMLRPISRNYVSGVAITDAPALTEAPKMIEVDAVFIEDIAPETTPAVETASLEPSVTAEQLQAATAPEPAPSLPEDTAPELTVTKPEEVETEMASLDTSKIDTDMAAKTLGTPSDSKIEADAESAPEMTNVTEAEVASGELRELSGTSWRLSALNGKDVKATAELHFDGTSGFAGGQGICNNYGGEFSESLKGTFDMSNIFSTETECPEYALEKQYIVALESADEYRMAPGSNELLLLSPDGKTIAKFQAF